MSEFTNPTDIARETLRLLATRRITPTPDNYQKLYLEIAGLPAGAATADGAEQVLELIAADMRDRPNGALASPPLEKALAEKDWKRYRTLLLDLLANKSDKNAASAPVWAKLVLDLIKQWEARHSGLTLARKRDSLEKVLALPGADPAKLAKKLQNLVKSWSDTAPAAATAAGDAPPPAPDATGAPSGAHRTYAQEAPAAAGAHASSLPKASDAIRPIAASEETFLQLRELLAQTLEFAVVSQLSHAPDLAQEAASSRQAATGSSAARGSSTQYGLKAANSATRCAAVPGDHA